MLAAKLAMIKGIIKHSPFWIIGLHKKSITEDTQKLNLPKISNNNS